MRVSTPASTTEMVEAYRRLIATRLGPSPSVADVLRLIPKRFHAHAGVSELIQSFRGPTLPGSAPSTVEIGEADALPVVPEAGYETGTPEATPAADVPETVQDVAGGVYDGGLDLKPEQPTKLVLSNKVQRVVNVDIHPIRSNGVGTGTSANAYGAWTAFGATSKRLDLWTATNAVDVQLRSADGHDMTAFMLPADTWIGLDVEATHYRIKSHAADAHGVYQVIAWL